MSDSPASLAWLFLADPPLLSVLRSPSTILSRSCPGSHCAACLVRVCIACGVQSAVAHHPHHPIIAHGCQHCPHGDLCSAVFLAKGSVCAAITSSLSLSFLVLSLSDLTTTYPSAPVVSSALHIRSYSQHSPPCRVSRLCREPKHHKRPCPSHPLPLALHSSPFSLTHTFRIPLLITLSR